MLQLVTKPVDVDIDESDLLSPSDAARIAGRAVQSVVNLMAVGTLPTYLLPGDLRKRPQKFTSKKSLLQFVKRRIATRKRTK